MFQRTPLLFLMSYLAAPVAGAHKGSTLFINPVKFELE